MASTAPEVPNIEFKKLSKTIFLYTPDSAPPKNSDPTTILFGQWMGISPRSRSLNSAYNHYRSLYPNSRILTIRSLPEYFSTASEATRLAALKPIVSAIDSDPAPEKRILVHLCSNGGTVSFADICGLYKKQTGNVLPTQAFVFDSAPGRPNATEAWAAMRLGLPKGMLWYPAAAVVLFIIGVIAIPRFLGVPHFIDRVFPKLNDAALVDMKAKRLYIYSLEDVIVAPRDPKVHLELAKKEGVDVAVLETNVLHMQSMVKEEGKYWRAVADLWESSRC